MTDHPNDTPGPNTATRNWLADYEARRRLEAECTSRSKLVLFDALAASGITIVVVAFDGCGDSGQIETIEARAGDAATALPTQQIEIAWAEGEPQSATLPISEVVEHIAYAVLRLDHDGWENNDGACGELTFDVAARTITLDFNARYTDFDHSQHVY